MNLLNKLFGKKCTPNKKGVYEFSVMEISAIGDKYVYSVRADNRQDAFVELVRHFYGSDVETSSEINSDCYTVHSPSGDRFKTDLPMWFARLIGSSYDRDHMGLIKKDRLKLEQFAKTHNIKLRN